MKQRKRVRANTSRMAWRAAFTRLLWDMLVLYEAMEEKLD
jgi:hypothetical protein